MSKCGMSDCCSFAARQRQVLEKLKVKKIANMHLKQNKRFITNYRPSLVDLEIAISNIDSNFLLLILRKNKLRLDDQSQVCGRLIYCFF